MSGLARAAPRARARVADLPRTRRRPGLLLVLLLAAAGAGLARWRPRAGAVEPFCPGGSEPHPEVVLCEGFEDRAARSRWNVGSTRDIWPASRFVRCTRDGFGFHDGCAAWSNRLAFDQSWGFWGYDGRRPFPPQSELYVRWYQYISDPYTWGTLEDKSLFLHDRAETVGTYVATSRNQLPHTPDSGPGVPFLTNYQDRDWPETGGEYTRVNRFQNQGRNITLQPGRWYLFEWHVRLNTPGVPDGVTRLWIDDASAPIARQTLRMHHTDMRWLRQGDAGKQLGLLRLTVYHQRCDAIGTPNTCPPNGPAVLDQSQRWDRIVVSRIRVGPSVDLPPAGDR